VEAAPKAANRRGFSSITAHWLNTGVTKAASMESANHPNKGEIFGQLSPTIKG
jgi:hypothetical protein